jgi:hypothetical protein
MRAPLVQRTKAEQVASHIFGSPMLIRTLAQAEKRVNSESVFEKTIKAPRGALCHSPAHRTGSSGTVHP